MHKITSLIPMIFPPASLGTGNEPGSEATKLLKVYRYGALPFLYLCINREDGRPKMNS